MQWKLIFFIENIDTFVQWIVKYNIDAYIWETSVRERLGVWYNGVWTSDSSGSLPKDTM